MNVGVRDVDLFKSGEGGVESSDFLSRGRRGKVGRICKAVQVLRMSYNNSKNSNLLPKSIKDLPWCIE